MREYHWTSDEYDNQPQEIINLAEMVIRVDGEQQAKKQAEARLKSL